MIYPKQFFVISPSPVHGYCPDFMWGALMGDSFHEFLPLLVIQTQFRHALAVDAQHACLEENDAGCDRVEVCEEEKHEGEKQLLAHEDLPEDFFPNHEIGSDMIEPSRRPDEEIPEKIKRVFLAGSKRIAEI